MATPEHAGNRLIGCPEWCATKHKPGELHPSHSRMLSHFGPYSVHIGSYEQGQPYVHLIDTRTWSTDPADRVSARESAMMPPDAAAALAGLLQRATTVPASRGGKIAKSAEPYAAALAELRQLGDALAEGVRILDATPDTARTSPNP